MSGSYVIAGGYVLADMADKVNKALKSDAVPQHARRHYAFERGLDTLIWQGLASVAIPGEPQKLRLTPCKFSSAPGRINHGRTCSATSRSSAVPVVSHVAGDGARLDALRRQPLS